MKQLTIKDLKKACDVAIKEGLGDKIIVISDDNEGNAYHGLFYTFTQIEESVKEYYKIYDSVEKDINKIVILG